MAEFHWHQTPPHGFCIACATSVSQKGFIDLIADVPLRQGTDIVGVVDVVLCASCIDQIGRMVGMASRDETEKFAYRELALTEENEKLKDEVQSWMERYEHVSTLLLKDDQLKVIVAKKEKEKGAL